jgi:hypothetical protein
VWNWLIRPKGRNRNGWRDIALGSLLFGGGIFLAVIAYDAFVTVASVVLIVSGLRWMIVGTVQRHDQAASPS